MIGNGGLSPYGPRQDSNRRRHPRLRCDQVLCSLGDVQDISLSGLRIRRRGDLGVKIGQEVVFQLTSPDGTINVLAKLVRSVKVGLGKYEFGLEWVKHDERLQSCVRSLAKGVVYNETLRPANDAARDSEW